MANNLLMTISKYPIRAYNAYAPIVSIELEMGRIKKHTTHKAIETIIADVNVSWLVTIFFWIILAKVFAYIPSIILFLEIN